MIDSDSGKPLNLLKRLKSCGWLDLDVLLGKEEKVPLRLVALPVPKQVANKRIRLARNNRDKRLNPSRERLALLGWNIFVTNVPQDVWSAEIVAEVYKLRWRIEIIFKAWKSNLNVAALNTRSEQLLRLSVVMNLLFCFIVHSAVFSIEQLTSSFEQLSFLRITRIVKEFGVLFIATVLNISIEQLLSHLIRKNAFYERRCDRVNYVRQLSRLGVILG